MRIRTVVAFSAGLAVGAGAAYLSDPEQGVGRRREARRWALAQGRKQVASAAVGTAARARSYAVAAVEGFRETVDSVTG